MTSNNPKDPIVLHISPIWLPQTQTWVYSQVAQLQRLGINAQVVCEKTLNLDQFAVAQIHCLADDHPWRQWWEKGLRKLCLQRHLDYVVRTGKGIQANLVHSHFGDIGWKNLKAVRKLGVRHVVTFYGYDLSMLPKQAPVWQERYRRLFQEADLFLCEGSHMAQCLADLGCPARKIKIQHLGVDIERLEFRFRKWEPSEPLKVLIAASFREKKGIPYAVEVLGLLRKEIPIELTIIGDAGNDPEHRQEKVKILQAIDLAGIKDVTRLLGFQPYNVMMQAAYDHHLFFQPSVTASNGDTEGGAPVSIIEMLATGMPVVSTTHCDIPEVMRPEAARFLAPERNVSALIDIVMPMIRNWQGLEVPMANLRSYVEREYDHRTQGAKLVEIYRNLQDGVL